MREAQQMADLGLDEQDTITREDAVAAFAAAGDVRSAAMAVNAQTLTELADKCGMPPEAFAATVARYNESSHLGVDRDFGKRKELLYPLEQGPFIALKQGTALLSVVGGLAINTHMEVLDAQRRPIPGLYAVGDTTGGMYGHEYVTTILGNSHGRALTWGYLAAARIAGVE